MKKWIVTAALALALAVLAPATALADVSEGDPQTVSEGDIVVGDGVTATFDEETGAVVFYSDGGTLWNDWIDQAGLGRGSIRSIKLSETSEKMYLPKDSSFLFNFCENLRDLDLRGFDTSNVTDMSGMFWWCGCDSADFSGFDTSNVTRMDYMFYECSLCWDSGRRPLDISSFDMSKVESAEGMLDSPPGGNIKIPRNVSCDVHIGHMFDSEGNVYEYLPNVSESITLMYFRDVTDPEKWYHAPVYWAFEKGITSGYGSYTFQPEAPLTRAQAVTFLYKFAGKPDVSGLEGQNFTDVSADAWYHDAVKWASANGITKGYGEGTFRPDAPCTRAMIVSFLTHYVKLTGSYVEPAAASDFTDVADNAWYKTSVDWAVANNITTGYGKGTFQPDVTCTRAMMVQFLKNYSDMVNAA